MKRRMTDFSLQDVFRDLAKDQVWDDWGCTAARLALMVVEERRAYLFAYKGDWTMDICLEGTLAYLAINPSHYAIVKKRVEEADTEEK